MTALITETIPFTARDGMALNLLHVHGGNPTRGPVVLAPGAGVRATLFLPPNERTIVHALVDDGWDVYIENWRASIDLPFTEWNLDQAAVNDHPAAVEKIVEVTGAEQVKAIIHCQGSSSFAMSAVAGLVPQVDVIVANSMSLHPVVPRWSEFKIARLVPLVGALIPYLDPRWGRRPPPRIVERLLVGIVRATHHECDNDVCKMISFTYGSGRPALWSHENLSPETHEWLSEEFGPVPLRFFEQMGMSVRAGRLVPTGEFADLPPDLLLEPPKTTARWLLLTGTQNRCFLPESQYRTQTYLRKSGRVSSRVVEVDGYGHLDMFLGRYADRDIFPTILDELTHSDRPAALPSNGHRFVYRKST
ncbi:hypothetical protein LV457_13800 [Mycobacterium sp. MYCO198283]|uniref:hypothetical protein n=1 Tax=Mycobacterium sp. MYCO198283 TaxID=2883505 RepID=UPI001E4339D1|nr:hypothetical protein [Mycobacterium sp. MYCO198283]MCG5433351.1 hypothetical protein [Mycobacterium sp. MYCO198283]